MDKSREKSRGDKKIATKKIKGSAIIYCEYDKLSGNTWKLKTRWKI
jgi:hypothetical protein